MKLVRASVIVHVGSTDNVNIETDLPTPFTYDGDGGQLLTLKFEATRGSGVKYVRKHFPGLPLEIVDASTGVVSHERT